MGLYDSLKLKQIAKFIGKTNPTTLHHIKQLDKLDLIKIDTSKIVGKYYVLTELGSVIMEEMEIGRKSETSPTIIPEKPESQSDAQIQANVVRTIGIIAKNIILHSASYIETVSSSRFAKSNQERAKEGQTFRITIEDLKLKTVDQANRLENLFKEFIGGIEQIKEESLNMGDGEIDIDQLVFGISIPVSAMHPEKIDEELKKKRK
ncbi:MAG: hypothetical protein GPJ54_19315 [Candidatus Heimdallarchaeota archaeon]|nr:hypothetical protein [Candidatus Heimdallarchaeota archaeon]